MSGNSYDTVVEPLPFAPFGWVSGATPAVPDFYWNVVSQEQRWKFLCCNLKALVEYANQLGVQINVNAEDIDKLQENFENLKDGKFWDFYEEQIQAWIDANIESLVSAALVKFVIPSITTDGYFCLYVPDSWNEIQFDFGAVYGRTDYGRIILRFDAEGNAIDNTYSYSLAQSQPLKKLIADLEVNTKRTDASYDTLFTNLDQEVPRAYD